MRLCKKGRMPSNFVMLRCIEVLFNAFESLYSLLYETTETLVISGKLRNYKPFEVLELLFADISSIFDHVKCKLLSYVRKMDKHRKLKLCFLLNTPVLSHHSCSRARLKGKYLFVHLNCPFNNSYSYVLYEFDNRFWHC